MNKLKITAYMFLLWAAFSLGGCLEKDQIYLDAKVQETSTDTGADEADHAKKDKETYFVYVCGAVKHPGVYALPAGSRIYEAIHLAGGLHKHASVKGLNQAKPVADGDMIEILTEAERKELEESNTADKKQGLTEHAQGMTNAADGLIDINTASAAQLMSLNGIGETKAANIIAYRESIGKFTAIEELILNYSQLCRESG